MRSKGLPHRQAYNVQTAVTEQQIILAAEILMDAPDFGHLEPMLEVDAPHLRRHGITERPEAVVGDAGYWHTRQIEAIADRGILVFVPPDGAAREGKRPGWEGGLFDQMREKLRTARGRTLYAYDKELVSYCTSGVDRVGSRSECRQPRRLTSRGVAGRRRLVEPFVLVVGLVGVEQSGAAPGVDRVRVHAELIGDLVVG